MSDTLDTRDTWDSESLYRLDLSGNYEYGVDSPGFIKPIASALKTNTSITELSLSGIQLNPGDVSIFSDAIPDMGSLASLTSPAIRSAASRRPRSSRSVPASLLFNHVLFYHSSQYSIHHNHKQYRTRTTG